MTLSLLLLPTALLLPTTTTPSALLPTTTKPSSPPNHAAIHTYATRRQALTSIAGLATASAALGAAAPSPVFAAADAGAWTKHEGAFDDAFFKDFQESKSASGFKYKFITNPPDDVEKPQPYQKVFVHYTGYTLDGKKFDSSYSKGDEPFSFRLNKGKVIRGWEGIVPGMKVGQRVCVKIPAEFAYGDKGIGPIPPNSDLVFYMELVSLGNIKGDKPRLSNLTDNLPSK